MNRRQLAALVAASAAAGLGSVPTVAATTPAAGTEAAPTGDVAMLLYPEFTALDLIGPQILFSFLPGRTVHLVAKTPQTVMSDTGVPIVPTATFDDLPADLEILFVPGGTRGAVAAMEDAETIAFLRDRGARAGYVTSVCTGALVLGAAGLLDGYKATTHWTVRDLLPLVGAEPVAARVVTDRNRITGGGVTAGIDFGLTILADLAGEDLARRGQLGIEYDPQPPFAAGSPEQAGPEATAAMLDLFQPFIEAARAAAERSAR
jgi:cyclohexyl-isocyanide hydratase